MGCDIHLYSETFKDGKWVADCANTFNVDVDDNDYVDMTSSYSEGRDYALFGLLCNGVRCQWPWSFEERGFPNDASDELQKLCKQWDGDGHSHSWLTVAELKGKSVEMLIQPEMEARELNRYLTQLINGLPASASDNPEQQRIVFWFDN